MEHCKRNRWNNNIVIQCNICLQRNSRFNLYFALDDIEQSMYCFCG